MKDLIGITPNCVISFARDLFSGSISDPEIAKKSGYIKHLGRGDFVVADRGFTIQDDLASVGARLVTPNFLKSKVGFQRQRMNTIQELHVYGFMLNGVWRE